MNITKDTAVTIAYRMTSPQGKPLDSGTTAYTDRRTLRRVIPRSATRKHHCHT